MHIPEDAVVYMHIPEDAVIKARLLQMHDFNIGRIRRGSAAGLANDVKLRVTVLWIEQFGVLHMAWAIENAHELKIDQAHIPSRKIDFADDISEAGRLAVDWVVELVTKFEAYIKQIGPECPLEFHDYWINRDWPK